MRLRNKNSLPWLWLAVLIVVIDQLSKHWAVTHLSYHVPVPVLPFLAFTLTYNTGVAFSFLSDAGGWQVYFFSAISLVIAIFFVLWLKRVPKVLCWRAAGLALIIGGALGNFIDRVYLHYVIDFIDFHITSWHFATFNVADSAVSVGAFLLFLSLLVESMRKK